MMRFYTFFSFLLISFELFCLSPQESKEQLKAGNLRFMNDQQEPSLLNSELRSKLMSSQAPFAVIVACADSRVAPEIVFDQSLGNLFVIAVAGNVIGPLELESIIYATEVLKSSYILVLGHQACGAVQAVIDDNTSLIPNIAKKIQPAVTYAENQGSQSVLKRATAYNAENMAQLLLNVPTLQKRVKAQQLIIEPGYYDFVTGAVQWLPLRH